MSYKLLKDDYSDFPGYASRPTIPPGGLLQSGGGVANFAHGITGGPYRRSSERSDVFGYSTPRTDKIYGNFYNEGPSYMENFDLWTPNRERQTHNYPYSWDQHATTSGDHHTYGGYKHTQLVGASSPAEYDDYVDLSKSKKKVENFIIDDRATTPIDDVLLLSDKESGDVGYPMSPYWMLALLILLFIAIDYWVRGSDLLLQKYLFKDKKLEPWHLFIIAIIVTAVFLIASYFSNTSIKFFERV